jgi:hypothetical protein
VQGQKCGVEVAVCLSSHNTIYFETVPIISSQLTNRTHLLTLQQSRVSTNPKHVTTKPIRRIKIPLSLLCPAKRLCKSQDKVHPGTVYEGTEGETELQLYYSFVGRYSDWLRAGRSGDRIPVGARFFAHVQTGPPCLLYNGYRVFPGGKAAGAWC